MADYNSIVITISATSYLLDGVDLSLNPLHSNPFPLLSWFTYNYYV